MPWTWRAKSERQRSKMEDVVWLTPCASCLACLEGRSAADYLIGRLPRSAIMTVFTRAGATSFFDSESHIPSYEVLDTSRNVFMYPQPLNDGDGG